MIDSDLGLSGAAATHRQGYKNLATQVAAGEEGIILSTDVTRLARNCSDWAMVANLGDDPGSRARPADHRVSVCLRQRRVREPAGAVAQRAEQRLPEIAVRAGTVEIGRRVVRAVALTAGGSTL